MEQIIKFNAVSKLTELSVKAPKPAREYMPDWYTSTPAFQSGKPDFDPVMGIADRTIKHCMPFADSLSLGYIQETWQDIHFGMTPLDDGTAKFDYHFPTTPNIMGIRQQAKYSFPIPEEFYSFELTWHPVWIPELPKGYSALITHPFNRTDLPFHTLTGVLDSDTFTRTAEGSNMPFLLKKGFTGIIKQGTPMYQIIPFKREEWVSESKEYNEDAQVHAVQKLRQHFWGGYKKIHWEKKRFN